MNESLPSSTSQPGWPERLEDAYGDDYVRLRDGIPTTDFSGEACLYGKLDPAGFIERDHLYVPTLGSIEGDVQMSGGTWMSPEAMAAAGITPIVIPLEPVT